MGCLGKSQILLCEEVGGDLCKTISNQKTEQESDHLVRIRPELEGVTLELREAMKRVLK